ncbi:hypothetical protein Lal_00007427 [Lupinus albus]|uniref:Uncharacterized protein n=1 Tax=Lupinus albus TaxID=3870 RepID=A0A6A4P6F8_LUPAL|nr:hypothetical protein Lalb_Chr16g0383371 [Lupinus albus]KAF1874812.1 hypothetical protein Lal_00007427 [Lupinus albus]
MSPIFYVTLFLALCLCNASIDSGNQFNKAIDNIDEAAFLNGITVHINLPPSSLKVHFKCVFGGTFEVPIGHFYMWDIGFGNIEKCYVVYDHLSASFVARDDRDKDHNSNWLIRLDGFFHSSDSITWEKRASWSG